MLSFLVYQSIILACTAWLALNVYFPISYPVRKGNGNLWAFALFNVIAVIILATILTVYQTQGWGITQYPSSIYPALVICGVVVFLQTILRREPRKVSA